MPGIIMYLLPPWFPRVVGTYHGMNKRTMLKATMASKLLGAITKNISRAGYGIAVEQLLQMNGDDSSQRIQADKDAFLSSRY